MLQQPHVDEQTQQDKGSCIKESVRKNSFPDGTVKYLYQAQPKTQKGSHHHPRQSLGQMSKTKHKGCNNHTGDELAPKPPSCRKKRTDCHDHTNPPQLLAKSSDNKAHDGRT